MKCPKLFKRKPSVWPLLASMHDQIECIERCLSQRVCTITYDREYRNLAQCINNIDTKLESVDETAMVAVSTCEMIMKVGKTHGCPDNRDIEARAKVSRVKNDVADIRENHGKTLFKNKLGLKNLFLWKKQQEQFSVGVTTAISDIVNRLIALEIAMKATDKILSNQNAQGHCGANKPAPQ